MKDLLQSLSEAGEGSRPWWRLPVCLLEWCGGQVESDATGLWWQCGTCGVRKGFVPRATLDRQIDYALSLPPQSTEEARS